MAIEEDLRNNVLDLRCFSDFLKDISQLDKKLQNKLKRSTVKRTNKLMMSTMRSLLRPYKKHTGYLRKSVRAKVRIKKGVLNTSVGLRTVKPYLVKNMYEGVKKPQPATYAGIWLNFGTDDHSNEKKSSFWGGRINTRGITGTHWTDKEFSLDLPKIEKMLIEDIEKVHDEVIKNNYSS